MKNPLAMQGLIYLVLAIVFTYFAISQVNMSGWTFMTFLMIAMATVNLVTGIKFVLVGLTKKKE
ncbi:YdiK family protein [Listeria grandensis]|uniref:YdiK family protein n=1 Tax=Listeria grandensis TaxID=1494963 RepID=A0A7X0Y5I9_9LIST|nr:YdiK family protein [Listeria grandensis]MBC1475553.1 YdiK family protein [Listeria grandensis]MBC1937364.1 YdiK family protein [Listeria grandensis]MBC6314227.1 YdiK family protein [Listeria grandensis]